MKTSRLIGPVFACLLLSGASVANADGEDIAYGEANAPAFSWTGVYGGVHGGYGWGDAEVTENLLQVAGIIPPSLDDDFGVDGGFGGIHIGANKQIGKLVLGAELSFSGSGISGESGNNCFGIGDLTAGIVQADCEANINWLLTGLAKVGYAFDKAMVYGTAGWAVAGVDYEGNISIPLIAGLTLPSGASETADGFAYGLGGEYALSNGLSIAVQYLHADLEGRGSGLLLGGIVTSGERDIDLDMVSARLNFRLGADEAAMSGGLKDGYAPAFSWTGVYAGVHGGYGWGDAEVTENLLQVAGVIPPSLDDDFAVDGGLVGVHLGVNKQIGKLVIGAELSLSGSNISGESGNDCFGVRALTAGIVEVDCEANVNWLLTGLAKVGYAFDKAMIYGTAGWAVAGVDYTGDVSIPLIAGLTLPSGTNETADGFAYGLGGEYALTEAVSLGVQYLHADLEGRGSGLLLGGIVTSGERDIDLDMVSARLNFRLGADGNAPLSGGLKDTYEPAFSWTGVYAGVHGGYGWGDAEVTENLLQVAGIIPPSLDDDFGVDGGLGGVHLGISRQLGNLVLGAEVALAGSGISGDSGNNCFGIGNLTAGIVQADCEADLDWLLTGLAKVGYAHNRTMIYGTAGWAVAGIDYAGDLSIPLIAGLTLPSGTHDTADGFAYGAGFEYAATDLISIGVQYLHADLESKGSGLLLGGIVTSGEREIDLDTVTARLSVKLGGN